jgi:hypothetical protein
MPPMVVTGKKPLSHLNSDPRPTTEQNTQSIYLPHSEYHSKHFTMNPYRAGVFREMN